MRKEARSGPAGPGPLLTLSPFFLKYRIWVFLGKGEEAKGGLVGPDPIFLYFFMNLQPSSFLEKVPGVGRPGPLHSL